MAEWYYIGPDKTGINCPDCCAAFEGTEQSCEPLACPSGGASFREYICPNPNFPTLQHIYAWVPGGQKSSVTIKVNSYFCPANSTRCYDYSPKDNLNAAGRIGSASCGNIPRYVTSTYLCGNATPECPPCGECCELTEQPIRVGACISSAGGCSCSFLSQTGSCRCTCQYQQSDSTASCYQDPGSFYDPCRVLGFNLEWVTCPDGTQIWYCEGDEIPLCPDPDPAPCYGVPPYCSPCGYPATCDDGEWICDPSNAPPPCNPSCGAGYYCACGTCICNTSATCCSEERTGWEYSAPFTCIPCYQGFQTRPDNCCDAAFKRKRCGPGEVCCNDGRCYNDYDVMCDINV